MRRWWLLIAFCLGSIGCDDARSRLDGVEPNRPDSGRLDAMADARLPRDAMPRPDAMQQPDAMTEADEDAAPQPQAACVFDVELIPTDELEFNAPIVDGETVYFTERGPEGFERTVRARDRAPVGGPSDRLVTARDGAFLLARPDGNGGNRLIYRDAEGDVPLSESFSWPIGEGFADWRVPQWVEPGRAVFMTRQGVLYDWAGGEPVLVNGSARAAALHGGRVVVAEQIGELGDGAVALRLDGNRIDVHSPVRQPRYTLRATDAGIWLAFGPQVYHYTWAGERTAWGDPDDPRDFITLDAWGDTAVATRAREDGRWDVVHIRRGDMARLVDVGYGLPALAGDQVFLAAWEGDDPWCGGREPGALNGLTPGSGTLAELSTGCMCCGAIWPPFVLSTSPTTIAWNYAGSREGPAIGIARRRCD